MEDYSDDKRPRWWMKGDWFEVCSCNVPCPCSFAQAPANNRCEGVMAYHVREGAYGDARLDGLNVIAVATFEGNAWERENPVSIGIFMDERASDLQREALQKVLTPSGARVQLHNAPGCEVGPGQVMTWGKAVHNEVGAGLASPASTSRSTGPAPGLRDSKPTDRRTRNGVLILSEIAEWTVFLDSGRKTG